MIKDPAVWMDKSILAHNLWKIFLPNKGFPQENRIVRPLSLFWIFSPILEQALIFHLLFLIFFCFLLLFFWKILCQLFLFLDFYFCPKFQKKTNIQIPRKTGYRHEGTDRRTSINSLLLPLQGSQNKITYLRKWFIWKTYLSIKINSS